MRHSDESRHGPLLSSVLAWQVPRRAMGLSTLLGAALALGACGDGSAGGTMTAETGGLLPGDMSRPPVSGAEGDGSVGAGNPGGTETGAPGETDGAGVEPGGSQDGAGGQPGSQGDDTGMSSAGTNQPQDSEGQSTTSVASTSAVEFYGRVDHSDPGAPRFDWPGVYIEAGFRGTSLGVRLEGPADTYFDVFIDGEKVSPIEGGTLGAGTFRLRSGVSEYDIAAGLPDVEHIVRLVKRSETMWSPVTFGGFMFGAGAATLAPARPALKLEFIGDSYTAGYGVESPSKSDPTSQDESGRSCSAPELAAYTNTDLAYGPLAARGLGAQYQINAYSGLGMVRHYDGNTAFEPFVSYYERTLQSAADSSWDFDAWQPDVVVLSLGRNDFSTPLGANDSGRFATRADLLSAYKDEYRAFLAMLRVRYPGVQIVNAASNLWPDDEYRPAVMALMAEEAAAGHADLHFFDFYDPGGFGCGWHPDMETQEAAAEGLIRVIQGLL